MKPPSDSGDTDEYPEFSDQFDSVSDHLEDHSPSRTPLLLQRSYVRSKSFLFDELRGFRISLRCCALDHSSFSCKLVSYVTFISLTVIVPAASVVTVHIPDGAAAEGPILFNKIVQLPESGLALISFLTLSRFLRRYGLRQLLFLDGLQDDSSYVRHGYTTKLDKAFRYIPYILLPSFFVEFTHKIIFFSSVKISIPYLSPGIPLNSVVFVLVLASWVYRTSLFLIVCVLFRLTCELQLLRLEGFRKLLEENGSEAAVMFEEHLRIRKQLSVTSHRYRFFIIGCTVTITVSQLGALLMVLASKTQKSFFNSGDVVVCSAVQLSGYILCLFGAAKITHRAQGVVSVASKWHMLMTCASAATSGHQKGVTAIAREGSGSGSDSDSNTPDIFVNNVSSFPSSFRMRQALVKYLQHNNGGITLFGFALDRGLLHTLFAFEFSIVLWILSKVVVLS